MELTCTICGTKLSEAFEGKAEARNWDMDSLVCHKHFDDVTGAHLVPTA